ncbi:hypothetical protein LLEC1_07045 [Akanthomyces lecanii]|uniref:Plasma membrane proteolipid 3 n=1 Tax=Cordyceps confragosa TaxID=2714763 RepID=A0A179IJC9_CORDF|nr:hypothetical protein LLEC1_07045 [Akanthomyces lecanii]
MAFTASDICKILLAIILPPVGVLLERGCGADLCINICLTILAALRCVSSQSRPFTHAAPPPGYIPGIIHALYIILKY